MIKGISRLVCMLPYGATLWLGRKLGVLYYHFAPRQRDRALKQIQESMQLSRQEAESVIRSSFGKIAQTFLEVLYMPVLTPATIQNYVMIENKQYLDDALAQGQGVAVLAAHMGNWEWLGAALALYGFPVASIIREQPNEQHTKVLNEYRRRAGIEVYSRGTSEVVGVIKALKRGKVVGFFSDQDAGRQGIFIDFFGKPASTHTGVAVFAQKLQVPVVPVFIVRKPEGGHRIMVYPPLKYEGGHESGDIAAFMTRLTQIIEDIIRQYPDEWIWFQKRWATQYQEKAGEQDEKNYIRSD